jgi:hypothetical protein
MADFQIIGASNESVNHGADTATSKGTPVTASATANTKGSWVELVASTSHESHGLSVSVSSTADVTGIEEWLIDIGIGGAGSEQVIINNIYFTATSNFDLDKFEKFYFPIEVSSGTRISVRCQQGSINQNPVEISVQTAMPAFTNPSLYNEIVSIGADLATSGGVTTDPGGTSNTKGAWTEMTASSSEFLKGVMFIVGVDANAAQRSQSILVDLGIGGSGSEVVILSNLTGAVSTDEFVALNNSFYSVSIPSGTRISVRHQTTDASNAADRTLDFILYGAVG